MTFVELLSRSWPGPSVVHESYRLLVVIVVPPRPRPILLSDVSTRPKVRTETVDDRHRTHTEDSGCTPTTVTTGACQGPRRGPCVSYTRPTRTNIPPAHVSVRRTSGICYCHSTSQCIPNTFTGVGTSVNKSVVYSRESRTLPFTPSFVPSMVNNSVLFPSSKSSSPRRLDTTTPESTKTKSSHRTQSVG